jgi:hypothetical protein
VEETTMGDPRIDEQDHDEALEVMFDNDDDELTGLDKLDENGDPIESDDDEEVLGDDEDAEDLEDDDE